MVECLKRLKISSEYKNITLKDTVTHNLLVKASGKTARWSEARMEASRVESGGKPSG